MAVTHFVNFCDILEFEVKNNKKNLEKTVLKMWPQIRKIVAYLSLKLVLEEKKNNLWWLLGTKLVLLVDF